MILGVLLIIGGLLGLAMGALSHPAIYRMVFGGKKRSADFEDSAED